MELDPPPALYSPVFPKLHLIVCHILNTQAGTVIPSWSRTFYIDLCVKFSVITMTAHLAD